MRRLVARLLIGVVLLGAVGAIGVYLYLRQSLPVVHGTIQLSGISAPVIITRDAHAIPHIVAASKNDGLFGLGYVHAQDRLWQMEFQRRIGHGRLSEVFGAPTIPQDRFLRTVGFGRAAKAAWDRLPDETRQQVDAYVAGVNAFIRTHDGSRLPPEFTLLRFSPEPFTGVDVLVWVKMMAWDLSANYSLELMRRDLAAAVGPLRMAELLPPYPDNGLTIVKTAPTPPAEPRTAMEPGRTLPSGMTFQPFMTALSNGNPSVRDFLIGGSTVEALGSNNWVVDGTMTASGKPLLANDPHLGSKIPSLWYLAHISAGDFDVSGATLPGAPAVALGRNKYIAWGATNVAADVEDLYQERLDAAGTSAEFRGAMEPMRVVSETITVKGAPPVALAVRITRHGPLISDAINANNATASMATARPVIEPLAFRWTALDDEDQTIVAFMRLNDARNWTEFTDALKVYNAPAQNFVYADVEGHIGYFAPGHVPVRAAGDGSRPVPGWSGDAEWTGWIPFAELPQAFDPPEHFIVTANNQPLPADHPRLIAIDYPNPYRAQRITDMLTGRTGLKVDDFQRMQADTLSLHAKALLPELLAHVGTGPNQAAGTGTADRAQAIGLLKTWNLDGGGSSAAEAIFQAWFLRLAPTLVGDELGAGALESYQGRFSYVTRFVEGLLLQGHGTAWCDNVTTPAPEGCDQAITRALDDALRDLRQRLKGDMAQWRWDGVHRAVFPHQGLDSIPPLRWLLSRTRPSGGDWSTVNVGPVAADAPYDQVSIPGYREILDLSPQGDDRYLDAVGQSGHFLSAYYDDALTDWQVVSLRKMRMRATADDRQAIGRLTLTPMAVTP